MRLRGTVALCLVLFALTGCFEADSPIYTTDDLWTDMPDAAVQSILAAPFFEEREIKISATGGATFMVLADETECPFGVAQLGGSKADGTKNQAVADPVRGIGVAVFNLKPNCHFNMAESPWMVYAAEVYPQGHARHDIGIAFGVPGDGDSVVDYARTMAVHLNRYRTVGEDRYELVSDAAGFKAFLPAYIRSTLVDFGK